MEKRLVVSMLFLLLGFIGTAAFADLNSGLAAHWEFEGDFKDSAGTNDATPMGDAKVVADPERGQVLELDGTGDYLEVPNSPSLNITGDQITLAAWVWHDDVSGNPEIIIAKVVSNTTHVSPYFSYGLHILTNGQPRIWLRLAGNVNAPGTTYLQSARWHHLAGVYDGAQLRLYLDGMLVATNTGASGNITGYDNVLRLGINGGLTEPMDGKMDDVRIYNRALSEREVVSLATGAPLSTAYNPVPTNGVTGVSSPLLQWGAGDGAVFHDVYLGTSPDLGPADLVASRSVIAMHWIAAGIEPGVTYYWRVDEVEADLTTVHTGEVWSFTTLPATAHVPQPDDGADSVPSEQLELQWASGINAISHDVYFGDDAAAVAAGTGNTFKGNQAANAYAPGALQKGQTYYWRVDEVGVGGKVAGPVWSFTTVPEIPIADPTLAGWWKFDEGQGETAVDWSGHGHHGTLNGAPQWVEGLFGGALDFEFGNTNECVVIPAFDVTTRGITLAGWVKPESFSQADARIIDKGRDVAAADDAWWMLSTVASGTDRVLRFRLKTDESATTTTQVATGGPLVLGEWCHTAAVWDGTSMVLYKDGVEVGRTAKGGNAVAANPDARVYVGNQLAGSGRRPWDGLIDDVRVYDKALTADELKEVMRGDPRLAWDPRPANNATTDAVAAALLSWQPGDNAAGHDVYLGTDGAAVRGADSVDTTGVYRGRVNTTSYAPDPAVEWGGQYFWRVDEVAADGTVTKGYVWSFTVADYLIVDDFESYDDDIDAKTTIFDTWMDGWVNDNGSQVGYTNAPFAERTIVRSGSQSMPLQYNNTDPPYYSQAERTFDDPQDWTVGGVSILQLQVRGRAVPGSVSYDAATGTYTMRGAGSNVWAQTDEFHFAFKELNGDGSITVRVDGMSANPPHGDPRIGVMIRDSLDPNAANALLFVEPDPRTRLTQRVRIAADTTDVAVAAIGATPTWLRLTRQGFAFKAERSDNGTSWTPILDTGSEASIFMTDPVYIGLVVCSHAAGQFIEATFSSVKTTGQVTPAGPFTTSQDIGIASNSPQPLYATLRDAANHTATVTDTDLVNVSAWTAWEIPLADFTGVDPTAIQTMTIGVGDRNPDGAGLVFIDDIRVVRPRPVNPGNVGLAAYYAFENNVEDTSGNGLHGTALGDPGYAAGPTGYGRAMNFDGTDDVVELGSFDVVGGGITLAAWINPRSFKINDARLISKAKEWGANDHWWMLSTVLSAGNYVPRFRLKTDESETVPTLVGADGVLAAGEWAHVTATWDGAAMVLYVDGVEVGRMAKGGAAVAVEPTVGVAIGSQPPQAFATDPSHAVKFFDGLIDEVRIYERALSELEARYLAGQR